MPRSRLPPPPPIELVVVDDTTKTARCDEGYLRVRRRRLSARYPDGSGPSEPFAYDAVERWNMDAVAVLPHFVRDGQRHLVLRSSVRPPLALRPEPLIEGPVPFPEGARQGVLWELVAGLIEHDERSPAGLVGCAVRETVEEVGLTVAPSAMLPLGGAIFPTAGVIGEAIYFFHCEVDLAEQKLPEGDGSPLERNALIITPSLVEALSWCDEGRLPDGKTEIAIRRLHRVLVADRSGDVRS
jgi:ADP-ribose pyrophosphatase